jgi:hypothetical protein
MLSPRSVARKPVRPAVRRSNSYGQRTLTPRSADVDRHLTADGVLNGIDQRCFLSNYSDHLARLPMHFVVVTKVELLITQQRRYGCCLCISTVLTQRLSSSRPVGILKAFRPIADTRNCFSSSSAEAILLCQLHTSACNGSMRLRYASREKTSNGYAL